MRKNRIFALLCALTMILCACKKEQSGKSESVPETTLQTEPTTVEILCEYPNDYQLFGLVDVVLSMAEDPVIAIFQSPEDAKSFCEVHPWECYVDVSGRESFKLLDVFDKYDDAYYADKYLMVLALDGRIFDFTLEIPGVSYGPGEQITVHAEVGMIYGFLDASSTWCVVLELDREYLVEAENVTLDIQYIKGKTDGYFAPEHPSRKQGDG